MGLMIDDRFSVSVPAGRICTAVLFPVLRLPFSFAISVGWSADRFCTGGCTYGLTVCIVGR